MLLKINMTQVMTEFLKYFYQKIKIYGNKCENKHSTKLKKDQMMYSYTLSDF